MSTFNEKSPTIGVVAISRNEEKDMPFFLEHLIDWVDEIIIVDDGSTDETVDIANSFGDKVKLLERIRSNENGGFAGQRNFGIDAATSDWLLHMDIDERVTPSLMKEIMNSIQSDHFYAYKYKRLNFFLHRPMKGGGWQDWNNPQLAKRGHHRFSNNVHETCMIEGSPDTIGQLKEKMLHLNDENYLERMKKSHTYCQNQAKRIIEKNIRMNSYKLILIPFLEFFRKFLKKGGFKDGVIGLLWALHASSAMFRACALVLDEQNQSSRLQLESLLKKKWENHSQNLD